MGALTTLVEELRGEPAAERFDPRADRRAP